MLRSSKPLNGDQRTLGEVEVTPKPGPSSAVQPGESTLNMITASGAMFEGVVIFSIPSFGIPTVANGMFVAQVKLTLATALSKSWKLNNALSDCLWHLLPVLDESSIPFHKIQLHLAHDLHIIVYTL